MLWGDLVENDMVGGLHFGDSIPLQDLFSRIGEHYSIRQQLKAEKSKLEKNTEQFRLVQKRMLTRFKEKNPSPLNNLHLLLSSAYQQIIGHCGSIERLQS